VSGAVNRSENSILQKLESIASSDWPDLQAMQVAVLSVGCEIVNADFGAYTGRRDQSLTSLVYRRDFGIIDHPADARSAQVILTRASLVQPPSYLAMPVLIGPMTLGSLAFWSSSNAPISLDADAVAAAQLLASLLAGQIAHERLSEQIAYQARHDALTGLPNRLFQRERLEQALDEARRSKTHLAVVFIDLDRFKQVNDTLGHGTGDLLLQQVARRLSRCLHDGNSLARMGGDEFTAIITGFAQEFEALQTVQRMLEAVRKPSHIYGYELFVTASMGVSFYPKDGKDAMSLLQNADAAMYMAKNQGRDGFCLFSSSRTEEALEHFELENYLRRAVENQELELLYQPQVDRENRLVGFEVLLVWYHPKLGKISPAQFIPIAEETGMIVPIGSWVLDSALKQAAAWRSLGFPELRVSVNVSPLQLDQKDFVDRIATLLEEHKVPPKCLDLEITESVVVKDNFETANRLQALLALGIRITIDDFGTGYSSLSYLKQIPAHAIKIDRSFFREDRQGTNRLELIRAIVTMAHSLGLQVTAEGIEENEQLEMAREAGCDEMQGHRFGIALRAQAAERYLKRSANQGSVLPKGSRG
jgi:diguanylate cyclase (GGDEF)-like protein